MYVRVDHYFHLLQGLPVSADDCCSPSESQIEFFLHLSLQGIQVVYGLLVHFHGVIAYERVLLRYLFLHSFNLLSINFIRNKLLDCYQLMNEGFTFLVVSYRLQI